MIRIVRPGPAIRMAIIAAVIDPRGSSFNATHFREVVMPNSVLLRRIILAALLAAVVGPPQAELCADVTIAIEPTPLTVNAAGYQARIDGDGCLSSLRIAGREFLAPGVSVSRGAYFFRGGALALPKIERPNDSTVVASGSAARVEYRFDDQATTWTVTNESEESTVFFVVLSKELESVFGPDGKASRPALTEVRESAAFALGDAKLAIRGINRIWGPWQGPHQVCEASLAPHETRQIVLSTSRLTAAEQAAVVVLLQPAVEPAMTIFSPLDYQVIQRSTVDAGECAIDGRIAGDADAVEFLVSGESSHGALPSDWRPADCNAATRGFSSGFTVPAGGWYKLSVRAKKAGVVVAESSVVHFGVGEVFVGGGQSNSTNCGQFATKQTSWMVASFGGDSWQLADDPQLGVADRSTGGSFWPAFGDAMYARYQVPIGVATTGFGGTSVNQWQSDGELFAWTMMRIRQLGPRGFRALLWHQGESDVEMPAEEYFLKLSRVIQASRQQARWQIPWFVAQASYHNMQRPRTEGVRSAQERLWKAGIALAGPDTDVLQEEYRDMEGKGIHFNPQGLKKHGAMWAEAVEPFVDGELKENGRP